MEKRPSAVARTLAALALIGAVVVLVVVVSGGTGGDSTGGKHHRSGQAEKHHEKHHTTAKAYVVQTGDTLIAISHKTGVPIAQILNLNPEVDPQILIAGETLKLR